MDSARRECNTFPLTISRQEYRIFPLMFLLKSFRSQDTNPERMHRRGKELGLKGREQREKGGDGRCFITFCVNKQKKERGIILNVGDF